MDAFHYLLKPIDNEKFTRVFEKAFQQRNSIVEQEIKNIHLQLTLDEAKMKETDIDVLESTLGVSGMFSSKIGFLASRVCANAQSNANSYSSLYGASGDIQSLLSSKHDWWG